MNTKLKIAFLAIFLLSGCQRMHDILSGSTKELIPSNSSQNQINQDDSKDPNLRFYDCCKKDNSLGEMIICKQLKEFPPIYQMTDSNGITYRATCMME